MPKPVKKAKKTPKRPSSDPVRRARQMLDEHMAKAEEGEKPWTAPKPPAAPLDFETAYKAHMAKLGSKGGKISGAKRMDMPEAKRKAIATLAAKARWEKYKR